MLDRQLENLLIALDGAINREEEKVIYTQIKAVLDAAERKIYVEIN